MTRECHVRFCEQLGGKFPGLTRQRGPGFDYIYDYGDAWWHHVTILDRTRFEGPLDSPWCLGGANACPPEDVGGIPGYEDFVEIIANPSHPEYEHMMLWYGQPFDPTEFDVNEVNQRLMEIQI